MHVFDTQNFFQNSNQLIEQFTQLSIRFVYTIEFSIEFF